MFSRKEWAHYSLSVTWYKILMQLYQNKCVNDLLPDLPNLNPSKKKKLGTLFLYSRPDCSPTDLFNALQLGNVCTYSRTELKSQPNRVFSHDVTAAILVSQNNETAAMLVSQTNPLGVELFSYANAFFCFNKFA